MKIDPVTYEVDMSAGTHPLYVWEAPVRVWHWAMMVCMFVMIVTGFLIGAPLVSNLGDTWATYDFAYIRFAHFAAGIIYTVLFIYRLYWSGTSPRVRSSFRRFGRGSGGRAFSVRLPITSS